MPANNIKKLRSKKGWTQKQLAEAAETSQQQIQRIEAGIQDARFDLAVRICTALGEPMDRVFPATALPLRRARKRVESVGQLFSDGAAQKELEQAGLDMDPAARTFAYRLRGGAEGRFSISGPESARLYLNMQREEEDDGFLVFDAGSRRIAINPKHLIFCHFLFDMPREEPEEVDGDKDFAVQIFLSDSAEPLIFNVDPDTSQLDDEGAEDNEVQLQDLVFNIELDVRERFCLTDEDGETAWFRSADVAMISLPLCAVEPKLMASIDDGEDEKEAAEETSSSKPDPAA
ncbi:MAG: helix-turn-helix transcriptional regulator [Hyphomicrobiaceae bacterium]